MFSYIKKLFSSKSEKLFSLTEKPSFEGSMKFTSPNKEVLKELKNKLITLREGSSVFEIENPLKEKKVTTYTKVDDVVSKIAQDLEDNYQNYTFEFSNEPMAFVYYLGNEILFSDTVEIVQEVYHQERDDIGNLYYSLVVKFNEGFYYYWKW